MFKSRKNNRNGEALDLDFIDSCHENIVPDRNRNSEQQGIIVFVRQALIEMAPLKNYLKERKCLFGTDDLSNHHGLSPLKLAGYARPNLKRHKTFGIQAAWDKAPT